MIDNDMISLLCCPLGKADLIIENGNILCSRCGVKFTVRDGIPVLLIEEAALPEGINSISELNCMKDKK